MFESEILDPILVCNESIERHVFDRCSVIQFIILAYVLQIITSWYIMHIYKYYQLHER